MVQIIGILFIILIAFFLLGGLLGLLYLLLQVAVITLPAWGVAVALMFLILYLFRAQRIRRLNSQGTLWKMVIVRFDGQRLKWHLEESQIKSYTKAGLAMFLSVILGITSVWLIIRILYNNGAFEGVTWWSLWGTWGGPTQVSPEVSLVFGCILSGIAIMMTIVGMAKFDLVETFKNSLSKQANSLVSQVNSQLERTKELRSLETSIKLITSQLEVFFPIDFQTEIQKFVDDHKTELLSDTIELNRLIARNIKRAREDRIQLEKANTLYKAAMKLFTETACEVNKTGSMPFVKELEYDYEGLTSVNLKSLLPNREWNDFHNIVNSIMRDLQRLGELAIKYQKEGFEEETESYKEETEEEKAYRTLGIPSTATNDQVKRAYKTLASIWHPDAKTVEDDTRMKQINWAYKFIGDKRNFK